MSALLILRLRSCDSDDGEPADRLMKVASAMAPSDGIHARSKSEPPKIRSPSAIAAGGVLPVLGAVAQPHAAKANAASINVCVFMVFCLTLR